MKTKNKVLEIKPPTELLASSIKDKFKIFVAGSIEQGKAEMWQQHFFKEINEMKPTPDVVLFNPRRDDWDPTWETTNKTELIKQIKWELEHLEKSDLIVMYLQPGTISPISLLELGLYAKEVYDSKKQMLVFCPDGFYRKTNVEVVCECFNISMTKDMTDLIKKTKAIIKNEH